MIKSLELLPCGNAPKGGDDYFVRNLYKIAKKNLNFTNVK